MIHLVIKGLNTIAFIDSLISVISYYLKYYLKRAYYLKLLTVS